MILLFQVVSFGGIQNVNADSVVIPDWIRTMVKFYADGVISDQEFAAAIEHLVKSGIIKSPRLSIVDENEQSEEKDMVVEEKVVIPDWIKNNARWYADGVIDDSTFIDGIEYMIEEEIIKSPQIKVKESDLDINLTETGDNASTFEGNTETGDKVVEEKADETSKTTGNDSTDTSKPSDVLLPEMAC